VFATAVESVGAEAYLYGESVLAILNLVPTNPTWINVATPMRKRKSLMDGVRVFTVKGNYSPVSYDGVRSQRVADAIVDCRNIIRRDRLDRALKTAVQQGYIRKDEVSSVKKGLQKP
jgi:predicted transcriptional regulator of viral defense system